MLWYCMKNKKYIMGSNMVRAQNIEYMVSLILIYWKSDEKRKIPVIVQYMSEYILNIYYKFRNTYMWWVLFCYRIVATPQI